MLFYGDIIGCRDDDEGLRQCLLRATGPLRHTRPRDHIYFWCITQHIHHYMLEIPDMKGSWDLTYSSARMLVQSLDSYGQINVLVYYYHSKWPLDWLVHSCQHIFGTVVASSPVMGLSAVGVLSAMVVLLEL